MVGSKCCDFKNRKVSNVNAPTMSACPNALVFHICTCLYLAYTHLGGCSPHELCQVPTCRQTSANIRQTYFRQSNPFWGTAQIFIFCFVFDEVHHVPGTQTLAVSENYTFFSFILIPVLITNWGCMTIQRYVELYDDSSDTHCIF